MDNFKLHEKDILNGDFQGGFIHQSKKVCKIKIVAG